MSRIQLTVDSVMYPMPALVIGTYDENGEPDAMTRAWGGIHDYNEVGISVSHTHKSAANFLKTGFFTVSFATEKTVVNADYVGIVSLNDDKEKMKKSGLTAVKSEKVNAPLFAELPLALECSVKSYDAGTGFLIGTIAGISADENILTEGKPDPQKFKPVIFDPCNLTYLSTGGIAGHAFSDGDSLK